MGSVPRVGDLEVSEDMAFQRREWTAERVGWALLGLLVVAAVLGLFAGGPLSNATAGGGGDLRVEYDRFLRLKAPTSLRVRLPAGVASEGKVRLAVSREYSEAMQVNQVTPQPDSVETGATEVVYVFSVATPDEPTAVEFELHSDELWVVPAAVSTGGGRAEFSHFVYP